ncbi:conserved exported hypothetical protein [uncultured Paludibacter sp.]|uniref:NlpC/P60 domain-containing protein n=1 Tax=uncultured Paludibacter sp. TaxID=497635 RepID=A0A653A616_9BACT|nr:conserved exported hypothetical protein [uncultured Paludibacter sp.]
MKKIILFLWFSFAFSIGICAQNNDIRRIVDEIQTKYVPDQRVLEYNIDIKQQDNTPTLTGVVSDVQVYQELINSLKTASVPFVDSIRVLPDKKAIGEKCWAFVPLSVINISNKPLFSAEIVSQTLMGTPIKLLDKSRGGWTQIQTPDGYIGWTNTDLDGITEQQRKAYNAKEKLIVTAHNAVVYEKGNKKSAVVSDVVMGNLLALEGKYGDAEFCAVSLPDGRKGFISTAETLPFTVWKKGIHLSGDNLIHLGKEFTGLPYFWGGTSARGMDCSGFTKTLYYMHGIILPRDASQQYRCGTEIDTSNGFGNLQKGDLLFFGRKNENDPGNPAIIHVAMYIGNNQFIHSSNTVRISSFDPQSPNFDEYNLKRFIGAKRILGVPVNGYWSIFEHEWYK